MFPFFTTKKDQKIIDFLMFSGGIQQEHWFKMAKYIKLIKSYYVEKLKQNSLTSF